MQLLGLVWNAKFTKSALHESCILCGSGVGVEMHHVRQIRDLRDPKIGKDFFTRQMEAINRKQVPLCRDHHQGLHKNEWTEEERKKYPKAMKDYSKRTSSRKP